MDDQSHRDRRVVYDEHTKTPEQKAAEAESRKRDGAGGAGERAKAQVESAPGE